MSELKNQIQRWEEGDAYITTTLGVIKEEYEITHAFLNNDKERNSALKAGDELIFRVSPAYANRANGDKRKFRDLLQSEELTIRPNTSDRPGVGTIVFQDLIEL